MASIAAIFQRAGVNAQVQSAFFEEVGEFNVIRELAGLTIEDLDEAFKNMVVKELASDGTEEKERKMKPVDETRVKFARVAARLRCDLSADDGPTTALAVGTVGPPTPVPMVLSTTTATTIGIELGSVWDQSSKNLVVLIGMSENARPVQKA